LLAKNKITNKMEAFRNSLRMDSTLSLLIRNFSYDELRISKMIGKGVYGRVYAAGMYAGIPVIIKSQNKINMDEVYVNYILINKILLKYPALEQHLVPTYGFFTCETKKSVCKRLRINKMNMVQKRIFGKTLAEVVNDLSLTKFRQIIVEIFKVLVILEKYGIYHKDLHMKNIMMEDGRPYIIDFGMAGGKTGFYDALSLFGKRNLRPDIDAYCKSVLIKVCNDLGVPVMTRKEFKYQDKLDIDLEKMTYERIQRYI